MYIRSYLTQSLIEATCFMNCPTSRYIWDSTKRGGCKGVAMSLLRNVEFWGEFDVKNGLLCSIY